jgi:AraC-like DNA-binding protein
MESLSTSPRKGITCRRVESPLGSWTHTEWMPPANHPLTDVVDRIWDFEGQLAFRRERVFPNGLVELIVQLDDRYHDVVGDTTRLTPRQCVTGLQTEPMVIEAPPRRCRVLGLRLHPLGAWAVLEHPLSSLTGLTVDLEDVLGAAARELTERCHDAPSSYERVQRAVGWVGTRVLQSVRASRTDPAVRQIAGRVASANGLVRIDHLRGEAGLTAGRLAAAFLEQVGVTPKRFARIHRFRSALEALHATPSSLSEVALACGYYDQPHMNAEFRQLAGMTPGQFLDSLRYPASTSTAEG